jgi:hypothetical protein
MISNVSSYSADRGRLSAIHHVPPQYIKSITVQWKANTPSMTLVAFQPYSPTEKNSMKHVDAAVMARPTMVATWYPFVASGMYMQALARNVVYAYQFDVYIGLCMMSSSGLISSMENVKNATTDMVVVTIHSLMAHFLFRPAQMDVVSMGGFVQYEISTIDPSTANDIAYGNTSSIKCG